MVRKTAAAVFLILVGVISQSISLSAGELSKIFPAESIKRGCALEFKQEPYPIAMNELGTQPYNIVTNWFCGDSKSSEIDRYNAEGGSPQIITVLFWRKDSFVVLVKWSISSQAADFQGDFYKVYIYKYNHDGDGPPFIKQEKVMNKFGQGWDGMKKGAVVAYPYKNASSIRRRLRQLDGR
ncbi:hypothetical protein [Cupriavidus sp. TMH.W2]|uniref:hypothetical protein n=1 Tax=Cupriavidus sp. TMH.W2 TaxID=3434465 RepID=UPI003D76E608